VYRNPDTRSPIRATSSLVAVVGRGLSQEVICVIDYSKADAGVEGQLSREVSDLFVEVIDVSLD